MGSVRGLPLTTHPPSREGKGAGGWAVPLVHLERHTRSIEARATLARDAHQRDTEEHREYADNPQRVETRWRCAEGADLVEDQRTDQ